MSVDPGPGRPRDPDQLDSDHSDSDHSDSDHLDEDPEALEDPVHSGDARHQHDLHHRSAGTTRPGAAPVPVATGDDTDRDD